MYHTWGGGGGDSLVTSRLVGFRKKLEFNKEIKLKTFWRMCGTVEAILKTKIEGYIPINTK
jgi:hypothetical protein